MYRAKSALPLICALACAIVLGCGSGGGGGLRDPGLSNVQVEAGNARSAVIGPAGGTITATGSNGVVYKLTVPPEAVLKNTEIALYPIATLKNLPAGGQISAGVNFSPNGTKLLAPATLTMQLPATIDPKSVFAVSYTGNAENQHLDLGTASGQTVTLLVHHFSGTVLGNRTIAALLSHYVAPDATSFQNQMVTAIVNNLNSPTTLASDFQSILRNWYNSLVKPALVKGSPPDSNTFDISAAVNEYQAWLDGILFAQLTLADPSFNVQPENTQSEALAVGVIKGWYRVNNESCKEDKNNPLGDGFALSGSPLADAEIAMWAGDIAERWHIPRAPNGLDKETLLNNLCVKVVIENKTYSGTGPGIGDLRVNAGFSIAGDPPRHDFPIQIKISGNGFPDPPDDVINKGASFKGIVSWPQGVNPLKIDILASLFAPNKGSNFLKDIAVFDQITKTAGSTARIAFSSDRAGSFDIYTMDADGSHQTRLTSSADPDFQPAISPDGTKVAFNRHQSPNDSILVMNIDGSNPVSLTNSHDLNPTWSPDGKKIAFESHRDGTGAIYVMKADGSNQTRITFNGSKSFDGDFDPSWSPDGTRIAFASTSGSPLEIRTIKPDGSNQQRITNITQDTSPVWSPDGTKIAFQSNRDGHAEIYVVNADGSNPTRLTNGSRGSDYPSWSPDGTRIAFHSHPDISTDGIFVMGANGGNPTIVTNNGRQPSFGRKP